LSSVAGNVFGLDAIKYLRLDDIHFPENVVKGFKGPKYGINGIRKLLKIKDRPLVGTIIKPKLGLKTDDHADVAYDAWVGGCDIVKDDENLSSQEFNRFEDRLLKTLEKRDEAETITGEKKVYMVNVTAETGEMIKRAECVMANSGRYLMVDIITCGFSALQSLRKHDLPLVIHAHRAGHAAFTRLREHGISMKVIAKIARILGVDQLHVGAAVGKMSETREEVLENIGVLLEPLYGFKRVLPVASGGLHPGIVPDLMDIFGLDFVIQAGGGIHGHPDGTISGSAAMRQAVDSVLKEVPLEKFANKHQELKKALQLWN
jgi:ribulose-bisphosphate carboxylase large chain